MKKDRGFMILCISYLLFYITMGVYSPYLNLYFERVGLNGSQIGLINSCGYIAAMIFSPIWGAITDKTHKYKTMISFLLLATSITGLVWQKQTQFVWILVFSLLITIFRSTIGNIFDGFNVEYCKQNGKEFSSIRCLGSLGYLIGSFVIATFMFETFNVQGPYVQVMLIASILTSIGLCFVKSPNFAQHVESEDRGFKDNIKDLIRNKDYIFILILAFFTSLVLDSANNYMGNHLVSTLNLPDSTIGLNTCAMVLPEVFIIVGFHRYIRRFGLKKVFIVALITQIVRFIVCALTTSLYVFLAANVVHGIMIGVASVGFVSYIHKKVPTYMLATAMTVYGAFNVVSYAVQSQLFGTVYQLFGSNMIFMITAGFTCVALVMVLRTKRLD